MTSARTLVLIVQYGPYEDLQYCLEYLTHSSTHSVDICVVDNNPSCKRDLHFFEQHFPSIHLVTPEENLGFSGGCNAGLNKYRSCGYDFFFILNNDAYIRSSDIAHLESIVDEDKSIGLIGPVVHDTLCSMYYIGMRINWKHGRTNHNRVKSEIQSDAIMDVDLVEGCGMMISRQALDTIHEFDTRYFLYWEDTDINLRIQEAGFRTVITGGVCMGHTPSQSTGQGSALKEYYMTRNAFLFFATHKKGGVAQKVLFFRMVTYKITCSIRNIIQGQSSTGKTQLLAIWDYLLNRTGPSARFNHNE